MEDDGPCGSVLLCAKKICAVCCVVCEDLNLAGVGSSKMATSKGQFAGDVRWCDGQGTGKAGMLLLAALAFPLQVCSYSG